MKMTHDTDVLKAENGEDLFALFRGMDSTGLPSGLCGRTGP